jgi:acetyl esterase
MLGRQLPLLELRELKMKSTFKLLTTAASLVAVISIVNLAPLPLAHAQDAAKDTMQRADAEDMRLVLQKLQELGAKPLGTQSVEETRKGPTPGDAANAVLRDQGKDPNAILAQLNVSKQDMSYPAGGGDQPIRIYTPQGEAPQGGWPVIVYYHGGGWVIATIDTYEASAMALANKAQAIVASVEYRHAPEYKFPAAHEDAFLAYKWVMNNAAKWGGNPKNVAVAGESAGGNLAINTAIMARDRGEAAPRHMLLVYPVAGTSFDTPSYQENANAVPLSKPAMQWFFTNATSSPQDLQDPRLDLVGHATLDNLPSATVITAEIDPLRSEGKELADKLKAAGSDVTYKNYEGVTHEFFGMAPLLDDAQRAQELAARELKEALAAPLATGSTSQPAESNN